MDAAYRKMMTGLIHLSGPAANTRASSIGNDCERALFYERTVPAEQRAKYAPELQAIFELGKDFEKIAIRRLEDMGVEIVQRGRDYMDERHHFSGSVDAKIRMPGWPRSIPVEIKGLNPYTGDSIKSLDDIRNSRQTWVRKYYSQLQSYLFLSNEELGAFVLFNKSTGWPTIINVPLDYDHAEGLLQRADRVQLAVVQAKPPERTLGKHCERCTFLHVCAPPMDYGEGATFIDNEELESLIRRREELSEAASEYNAISESLKDALPKKDLVIVGEFVVRATEVNKKAESKPRAGYTYWLRKYELMTKKEP
jgi:CRISPR/Cas system-associated exonuclease Cas4 (RecB family)